MLTRENLRTAPTSEFLGPLLEIIEEKQRSPEGRAELARDAARYANAIKICRAAAACAMQREAGRKPSPEEG